MKTVSMRFRLAAVLFALLALASSPLFAQAYPTKPVVAIVPFSPGGGNDILLRLVSKHANAVLGQTLVVENKPGAGGQIGWTALGRSKADGYSIGATSLPSMILIKAMRPETPFELDDFRYICNIQVDPVIWVVKADSRFKSGKLRAIVLFNDESVAMLPGVPAASAYFGKSIPSVGMAVRGLAAPKDIAPDRLAKLEAAFKQICESPAFLADAKDLGIMVKYSGTAESEALVKASLKEVEALKDLLK